MQCPAKELLGTASRNFITDTNMLGSKVVRRCSSCSTTMVSNECVDVTFQDEQGESPPCRRFLDFDYCHQQVVLKYAGTHSCLVGPKIKPMDVNVVRTYFKNNPSSTPVMFRHFIISEALKNNDNVTEVSIQYADLTKIRNIQAQLKKEINPDGTGLAYLETFAASLKSNDTISDEFLLEVERDPFEMIVLSSIERL